MHRAFSLTLSLLALFCASTSYSDQGLSLLPVDGLYGVDNSLDQSHQTALIHKDFLQAIGYNEGPPLIINQTFQQAMHDNFGSRLIDTITSKNKSRTYAASLQIVRADQYAVKKPDGNIDIYLPVTLNLYFTNILTGEVLFSKSATSYQFLTETQEQYQQGNSQERIADAYRKNTQTLIKRLTADAAKEFSPFTIEALVIKQWAGFSIIDKGIEAGISQGVELLTSNSAGLKIIYSDHGYAIGIPTLGDIKNNDTLSFYSTTTSNNIQKPRVLVLDADTPEDLSGLFASTQFSENIGNKAAFTITPVNPTYQSVLQQLVRNGGLQQAEITQKRALPDYFIRIKILPTSDYELASNQNYGHIQIFEATGFAELLDSHGQVLFSTQARSRIEDKIVHGGMVFDATDRHKVLYSNLLDSLSKIFIEKIRFNRTSIAIKNISDQQITLDDPSNLLMTGQNVRLFHKLSINNSLPIVQIPIWELQINDRDKNNVHASYVLPYSDNKTPKANIDDFIQLDTNHSTTTALHLNLCQTAQDKGAIKLPQLLNLAYFIAGSQLHTPFFGGDFALTATQQNLNQALNSLQNAGFSKPLATHTITTNYCLEPLIKIDESKRECNEQHQCELTIQTMAGWQAKPTTEGANIRKLMNVESHFSHVPENSLAVFINEQMQTKTVDLLQQTLSQLEAEILASH